MGETLTKGCERANHEDSDDQTVPETWKSDVFINAPHSSPESFAGLASCIELADHHICGVGDNGTEDTG